MSRWPDWRCLGSALALLLLPAATPSSLGQQNGNESAHPHFALELPSSPEFFRAAARVAKPRWRQLYRATPRLPRRERNHSAFVLGTLLCETLIASEARDAQYIRNSTQDIRDCLTLLGLADALDQRLPAIHEFAARQNWPALRFEIEALEAAFERRLEKQMDAQLAPLISLGHQLRCLDICACIALESGQPIGLDDPDYYAALSRQIDAITPAEQTFPLASDIAMELRNLQTLWSDTDEETNTSERIAVTARNIRGLLDRIIGAER